MIADTTIASHGVPYRECLRVSAAGRYPSSAMAKGMRVVVSTVLLSSATLPTIAASVIHVPSHGPPIIFAASEKNPGVPLLPLSSGSQPGERGQKVRRNRERNH